MKKKICGIYKITNKLNGKAYIGQSIDICTRWQQHKSKSSWRREKEKALYHAFMKYGLENFTFEVLEECKINKLDEREIYWIKKCDSYKNGYNMTKGGYGDRDYRFSFKKRINDRYYDVYELYLRPTIYDVFQDMKYVLMPFADEASECNESIIEAFDGYDTLIRDFCDGYDNFEQWAECNLI